MDIRSVFARMAWRGHEMRLARSDGFATEWRSVDIRSAYPHEWKNPLPPGTRIGYTSYRTQKRSIPLLFGEKIKKTPSILKIEDTQVLRNR